jgi:hypothetical protein
MCNKIIILIFLLIPSMLWAACPVPVGTVYTAVDVSVAEVQSCINAADAAAGGTVQIPAGTSTWTTALASTNFSHDIIIQGAGTGGTGTSPSGTYTAITGLMADAMFNNVRADGTISLTIKDMRLIMSTGVTATISIRGTSLKKIIKNIYFDMSGKSTGRAVIFGSGGDATQGGGVVTGCYFYNPTGTGQDITPWGNVEGSYAYWNGNPQFGTANATYIEGCTFDHGEGGFADGVMDAKAGVRMVFRYNEVKGSGVGWHGYDSSSAAHSVEVYRNNFTNGSYYPVFHARSGTALIWGNRADSSYGAKHDLMYYRACAATDVNSPPVCGSTGQCAGDGGVDQCVGSGNHAGYRCYQQPGSTGDNGITQWPMIEWDNIQGGGATANMTFGWDSCKASVCAPETFSCDDLFQAKRDYINHDTCVGDGGAFCLNWWDDVNKKGKLNGSTYTAYTCPHPLTGLTGSCSSTAGTAGYDVEGDVTAPVVTAFTLPATNSGLSATVTISSFTCTDATGVTGYCVNTSATPPTSGTCSGSGWAASAQSTITFASTNGLKIGYAWCKDAAGNISDALTAQSTLTLGVRQSGVTIRGGTF